MNRSFENGIQFAWDSTSIKLAETCLYKYKLKMIDGWQPFRKSVHLLFGGWYATALESYHKYRADGMDHDEAVVEIVGEALVETWVYDQCEDCNGTGKIDTTEQARKEMAWAGNVDWAETTCETCSGQGVLPGTGTPWHSDHNTKTRENLIRTIVWYTEQFREDPCTTVILSNGQAAVEHSFRLPVDDGIILSGHLDRLVEYGGKTYVQDQKTTGTTITPRYFEGYSPDTQMSLYTFAGKAIFGVPVKGVIIDAAQIAVGFTRFERGFTFRDDAQLDEWYDNSMKHIERARKATAEAEFPMTTTSCGNFGGCEFRNICSKSPAVREQFLKADFARGETWDPLKTR